MLKLPIGLSDHHEFAKNTKCFLFEACIHVQVSVMHISHLDNEHFRPLSAFNHCNTLKNMTVREAAGMKCKGKECSTVLVFVVQSCISIGMHTSLHEGRGS